MPFCVQDQVQEWQKVDRLKSRLIVNDSQQHKGIDYSDTFAPVVKYTTFRLFVAIYAIFKMRIHQLDVKNALRTTGRRSLRDDSSRNEDTCRPLLETVAFLIRSEAGTH